MQNLPVNGILMVTTPQALATMVVNKTVTMAHTLKIPILGIIENMTGFFAEDTGHQYDIFGPSHSEEVARASNALVLTHLPLRPELTKMCDDGMIESADVLEIKTVVAALESFYKKTQPI